MWELGHSVSAYCHTSPTWQARLLRPGQVTKWPHSLYLKKKGKFYMFCFFSKDKPMRTFTPFFSLKVKVQQSEAFIKSAQFIPACPFKTTHFSLDTISSKKFDQYYWLKAVCSRLSPSCMSIAVAPEDPVYGPRGVTCLPLVRSPRSAYEASAHLNLEVCLSGNIMLALIPSWEFPLSWLLNTKYAMPGRPGREMVLSFREEKREVKR